MACQCCVANTMMYFDRPVSNSGRRRRRLQRQSVSEWRAHILLVSEPLRTNGWALTSGVTKRTEQQAKGSKTKIFTTNDRVWYSLLKEPESNSFAVNLLVVSCRLWIKAKLRQPLISIHVGLLLKELIIALQGWCWRLGTTAMVYLTENRTVGIRLTLRLSWGGKAHYRGGRGRTSLLLSPRPGRRKP